MNLSFYNSLYQELIDQHNLDIKFEVGVDMATGYDKPAIAMADKNGVFFSKTFPNNNEAAQFVNGLVVQTKAIFESFF